MSNGKKPSPLTKPGPPPVVPPAPVCSLGQRCHINGKGITTFGTKFPLALVQKLASSSITLVGDDVALNINDRRVASGVLIAPEVALFAAHSLSGIKGGGIKVLMSFECDTATAPPGMFFQHRSGWPACTSLAKTAQAVEVKTLEVTSGVEPLDYAIMLIKWNSASTGNVVTLPRVPVMPKPGRTFTKELLLIGHPNDSGNQGEPTQACAFKLVKTKGPDPRTGKGDTFCYGDFGFTGGSGFSGGGVFNEQGELVGLLHGTPGNSLTTSHGLNPNNFAFLDLGLAADHTENDPRRGRLAQWFKTGNPLKPGEGGTSPTFKT